MHAMCTDDDEEANKTIAASIRGARQAMLVSKTVGATSDRIARAMVCGQGLGLDWVRGQGLCRQCKDSHDNGV